MSLAIGGLCASCDPAPSESRAGPGTAPAVAPNLILILVDTLRADAVFDPREAYDTPNLDRLARAGVSFEHAFAGAPMTLPSHVSLFSSRPVLETGVFVNGQEVPRELPLVAEWLAQHGYDTRAVLSIGTLHSGFGKNSPQRGFALYDCDFWNLAPAEKTFERLRAALAGRNSKKPLFLFAHFADPHEPYEAHGTEVRTVRVTMNGEELVRLQTADMQQWIHRLVLPAGRTEFELVSEEPPASELGPKRRQRLPLPRFMLRTFECREDGKRLSVERASNNLWEPLTEMRVVVDRGARPSAECELRLWATQVLGRNDTIRKRYALEVAHVDRYVGELLAELERQGLYHQSLIVFTSDHGEGLGEHHEIGHVQNLSDGLLRVPLIVKLPDGDPRVAALRSVAPSLVSQIDLVPTLLEVAGLPPLPGQRGVSLLQRAERLHVAQTSRPEAAKNQLAFRDEAFKMVFLPDEERFELYDVAQDPGELTDVFATRSAERPDWPARLRAAYAASQAARSEPRAEGEPDPARDDMLRALGYGGEGDDER
jgi:arylsulfatase A-like enzyme